MRAPGPIARALFLRKILLSFFRSHILKSKKKRKLVFFQARKQESTKERL